MNVNVNLRNRRLSLLQVLEPSGGGSGRHFVDLCRAMQHRGHSVTAVYSPVRAEARFVGELEGLGLHAVIPVPMRREVGLADISTWWQLRDIAKSLGPFDLIHGHSSKAGALTRLRLPGGRVPVVYTPHAFRTMDPSLGKKGRLVFGGIERMLGTLMSDRVICVSQDEFDHALSLGIPEHRLRIVVNGVSRPPVSQRAAIRDRFGIPADAMLYGFIGRLTQQKAPERLVEAFARVAAQQPSARLLMIGSGELAPLVAERIRALGLQDRAFLDSSISGPVAIDAFDVLVAPSRYDAMPYVLLEAAARGKPLVVTDVGGTKTVVESGRNGLVVANSDDPADLAAAMQRLANPQMLKRFAAEAHRLRERFTVNGMADQTEEIYFDLLGYPAPALLREPERALRFSA